MDADASGIKEGEGGGGLPRVITIDIVNFDHIKTRSFTRRFGCGKTALKSEDIIAALQNKPFMILNLFDVKRLKKSDLNPTFPLTTKAAFSKFHIEKKYV
ncbi:MAG: hypothetical protein LBG43_10955 [Treponema sp.]|nr:hypothetical protein [Treponema sp.]